MHTSMPTTTDLLRRRLSMMLLASAVVLGASACDDSTTEPDEEEPQITAIVVTSGASSIRINPATGAQTGSLALTRGAANTVSVRFLGANEQDEAVVAEHRSEYELRLTAPTTITLAATGGSGATFTGTLTPVASLATGAVTVVMQLYNREHSHAEATFNVAGTIQ